MGEVNAIGFMKHGQVLAELPQGAGGGDHCAHAGLRKAVAVGVRRGHPPTADRVIRGEHPAVAQRAEAEYPDAAGLCDGEDLRLGPPVGRAVPHHDQLPASAHRGQGDLAMVGGDSKVGDLPALASAQ